MKLEKGKLHLTAKEIKSLVYEDDISDIELNKVYVYETLAGTSLRWNQVITLILEYNNKYYKTCYMKGLTECQEDMFDNEVAYEVKRVAVTKYIWEVVE